MSAALREIPRIRQNPGEAWRRWFYSDPLDILLWIDAHSKPVGFQLSYRHGLTERVLTWRAGRGFDHMRVLGGRTPGFAYTPAELLVTDPSLDIGVLRERFGHACRTMPEALRRFVSAKLEEPFVLAHAPVTHPAGDDDDDPDASHPSKPTGPRPPRVHTAPRNGRSAWESFEPFFWIGLGYLTLTAVVSVI